MMVRRRWSRSFTTACSTRQRRGPLSGRVSGSNPQLGPGVRAGDIDGRVLPDDAFGPRQPADVETVHLNSMTRPMSFDMELGKWRPSLRLGWHREAANQSQALGPVTESVVETDARPRCWKP